MQPQRVGRHDDLAQLRMLNALQHAALMHVRVVHHLGCGAYRRAGNAAGLEPGEHLHLAQRPGPFGDDLAPRFPRLVYASSKGYGHDSRFAQLGAMDFTIQAASGIMSITGAPDGPPMKAGPTLVDFMGGIHLYGAVMTALFERERSGQGRLVEVAMQETVYSSLAASFEYYHRTGNPPPRTGNRQAGLSSTP